MVNKSLDTFIGILTRTLIALVVFIPFFIMYKFIFSTGEESMWWCRFIANCILYTALAVIILMALTFVYYIPYRLIKWILGFEPNSFDKGVDSIVALSILLYAGYSLLRWIISMFKG